MGEVDTQLEGDRVGEAVRLSDTVGHEVVLTLTEREAQVVGERLGLGDCEPEGE